MNGLLQVPQLLNQFMERLFKKMTQNILLCTILFVFLSYFMGLISKNFYYDQYVGHVQDWHKYLPNESPDIYSFFQQQIDNAEHFFIVDAVWAFFLMAIFYYIFYQFKAPTATNPDSEKARSKIWLFIERYFPLFLLLTYGIDLCEGITNWLYLIEPSKSENPISTEKLELISSFFLLKMILYALVVLLVIFQFLKWIIRKNYLQTLRKFFQHNNQSLLVITALVFLMTRMEQGGALIDRLAESNTNIFLFFIVLNILVYMTWHWPYYHDLFSDVAEKENLAHDATVKIYAENPDRNRFRSSSEEATEKQIVSPFKFTYWFTALFYKPERVKEKSKSIAHYDSFWQVLSTLNFREPKPNIGTWFHLQRVQASLIFYLAIIIILQHVTLCAEVVSNGIGIALLGGEAILLLVVLIWFYRFIYYHYKSNIQQQKHDWETLFKWIVNGGFFLKFLLVLAILFLKNFQPHHFYQYTLYAVMLFLYINSLIFLAISIVRRGLASSLLIQSNSIWSFLPRCLAKVFAYDFKLMSWLAIFSTAAIVFVSYTALSYDFNALVNPINIILVFIIFYFTIFNFLAKTIRIINVGYVSINVKRQAKNAAVVTFFLLTLPQLYHISQGGNKFHSIVQKHEQSAEETSTQENTIDLVSYVQKHLQHNSNPEDPIYIFVGDGGGLRAAYWNLLIMRRLDELSKGQFYENTLAVTGVSGGMIGQGIYFTLKGKNKTPDLTDIRRFGSQNFLSNDASSLLGKHVFASFLPYDMEDKMDSQKQMARKYMQMVSEIAHAKANDTFESLTEANTAFRAYWKQLYQNNSQNTPLLLVNSTQSQGSFKGIATPLQNQAEIFPASISMVDFPDKQDKFVSFADAIFTSNRFPFFSPAGEIAPKGHFIDGGYHENSGISTILDMLDHLEHQLPDSTYQGFAERLVLVSLHDAPSEFIRSQFWEYKSKVSDTKDLGEFNAVLSGLTKLSTVAMPVYWEEKAERLAKANKIRAYHKICIPTYLNQAKIQQYLGGKVSDQGLRNKKDTLNSSWMKAIENYKEAEKDKFIDPNYVVEPPLNRIQSDNIIRYMEAMSLEHPLIDSVLLEIIN